MKDRLLHIILLFTLCLVVPACSDGIEEVVPDSSISVSLGITTRAVEQEGMEVGDGLPQSLKVWIYGVKENEEGETLLAYISQDATESPIFNDGTDIYGNPVEVVERELEQGKEYGKLNFYVVLNDGAVTWPEGTSFGNDMTPEQLKAMTFSLSTSETAAYLTDNEQLMYGESSLDINEYKTNYEIEIPVERSVAKLELYFSKNDASKDLTVNSVSLESDVIKGYMCPQTTLGNIYGSTPSVGLLTAPVIVNCTSTEEYGNFSNDEKNFEQTASSFLLENPVGLDWEVEGERYPSDDGQELQHAYKVTIGYTYDEKDQTESFYLPKVERNVLYKIYVRIRELDWEVDLFPYTDVFLKPEFGL